MKTLYIEGHALWPAPGASGRPTTTLLGANERRRAPEAVLTALAVAEAALQAAGVAADGIASVFASAYGDLAIVDSVCRTLAADPLLLSPTRFHHSVHNAASGYWAIGAGNRASSSAVAAAEHSFAAGWLEAACQCEADTRAVLLVGCDTEARGALASVNASRGLLGVALVLAPERSARSRWAVGTRVTPASAPAPGLPRDRRPGPASNPMAAALPLFAALDGRTDARVALALAPGLTLELALHALHGVGCGAGASSGP